MICIYITRGSITLSTYSENNRPFAAKSNRRCFVYTILFQVKNGGWGNMECQRIVRFSIHFQVIRSLLFSLLISQFAGGNQQAMSAFQHELRVFTVLRQSSHSH